METLATIKHHIANLVPGEIFTTKQMLKYGERKRIDLALSQLVKEGKIRRLSYGVFCLSRFIPQCIPSNLDVVLTKVSDAKRGVVSDGGLSANCNALEETYYTDGNSSTFICQGKKIILKRVCGRKYTLSQSSTGKILLALWMTGKRTVDAQMVHELIDPMSQQEKSRLRDYLEYVPGWLHGLLLSELIRQGF